MPTVPSEILLKLTHLSTFFHLFDAIVTLCEACLLKPYENYLQSTRFAQLFLFVWHNLSPTQNTSHRLYITIWLDTCVGHSFQCRSKWKLCILNRLDYFWKIRRTGKRAKRAFWTLTKTTTGQDLHHAHYTVDPPKEAAAIVKYLCENVGWQSGQARQQMKARLRAEICKGTEKGQYKEVSSETKK